MEYYKNIVCVTVEDLTRCDDGEAVMSIPNYKQLAARKRINVVRKAGGLGACAFIEFESMPERFKQRFIKKYGEPEELIKKSAVKGRLVYDGDAKDYFDKKKLSDGRGIPDDEKPKYVTNATVLNELIADLSKKKGVGHALNGKAQNVWESLLETSEQLREIYDHTLPGSVARLKGKINEYKRDGYECLILKKLCNKNTIKIKEDVGDYLIALKRCRVPVYNDDQILEKYNAIADGVRWKPIKSVRSIVRFFNSPEVEPRWYDAVYGELAANQRYGRKHKTILPKMRDAQWCGDGTKLNLYYKGRNADNKLVLCSTSVYEVMDVASEVFLGYYISDHEDYVAQCNAFRMAVERSKHKPYEIIFDNQGGHLKDETQLFLKKISKLARPTAPYSGQSKTIESAFGRFQQQHLRGHWNFTGQNITATSQKSRANLELIEANKESLLTLSELKEVYAAAREEWNNAPHPSTGVPRIEMYLSSVNEKSEPVSEIDMIDLFWETTKRPSTFTPGGIEIEIDGNKYTYDVYGSDGFSDYGFRDKYLYAKFIVKYDLKDMTNVKLYSESSLGLRFVTDARPYIEIHRARQEQQPWEAAFIVEEVTRNKKQRIEKQIKAVDLEMTHGVALEQHGLKRPKMKGISGKLTEQLMDRELVEVSKGVESVDVGVYNKTISNMTYDQVSMLNEL